MAVLARAQALPQRHRGRHGRTSPQSADAAATTPCDLLTPDLWPCWLAHSLFHSGTGVVTGGYHPSPLAQQPIPRATFWPPTRQLPTPGGPGGLWPCWLAHGLFRSGTGVVTGGHPPSPPAQQPRPRSIFWPPTPQLPPSAGPGATTDRPRLPAPGPPKALANVRRMPLPRPHSSVFSAKKEREQLTSVNIFVLITTTCFCRFCGVCVADSKTRQNFSSPSAFTEKF